MVHHSREDMAEGSVGWMITIFFFFTFAVRKQRQQNKQGLAVKPQVYPVTYSPARLCLLKLPHASKTTPPAGDQGFNHTDLWATLHILITKKTACILGSPPYLPPPWAKNGNWEYPSTPEPSPACFWIPWWKDQWVFPVPSPLSNQAASAGSSFLPSHPPLWRLCLK